MKKNKLTPIYLSFLLSSIFLNSLLFAQKTTDSTDELYKKVFGSKTEEEKTILVDATLGDFFVGEVSAIISNESLKYVSGKDLYFIIKDKIKEDVLTKYQIAQEMLRPEQLPFKVTYHPAEIRLSISLAAEDIKPNDANVYDDLIPYFSRKAIDPAPFSMGINYKVEQAFYKNTNQQDNLLAQVDAFATIKKVSLENQMSYLSNRENKIARQNSRAIFDRPHRMQRFEFGDVNFPILGYQQGYSIGGFSFYKDFALNPYRMVTPTSSFEYQVESRSLVKTFVNNVLLKTEYMNPGRYQIRDIPLNNGLNKIVVELIDEFGQTKTFVYNESGSLDLLASNVSRYSLSAGYTSIDSFGAKKYEDDQGVLLSSFYQHGMNRHWTLGGYHQGKKSYNILGLNNILSTVYGNWSHDITGMKNKFHSGVVSQLTYQLNLFGAYWFDSHNLTAKVEYRSPFFSEVGANIRNSFDFAYNLSYSVPLFEKMNLALGGTYQTPTIAENARMSVNTSLTAKLFESSSLTLYAARARDEVKNWSNQMYVFFNMTFGDSSTFVSAFYEKESRTKRLTLIRDNGIKYNDVKVSATADQNNVSKNASLDLQYNTVLADLGARSEATQNGAREGFRTTIRFLSSFAYVYNEGQHGFSIGRPISNSFVIFKPNKGWEDQKFGVQTSSGINDSSTGLFGESMVSSLTPYQYKRIQLDPSQLDPGYVLKQESFVVYPRKNSGHLFTVGESGFLVIRGQLIDKKKNPISLQVGVVANEAGEQVTFFTDREGQFFIEGVKATSSFLKLDNEQYKVIKLELSKDQKGILDLGKIVIDESEANL